MKIKLSTLLKEVLQENTWKELNGNERLRTISNNAKQGYQIDTISGKGWHERYIRITKNFRYIDDFKIAKKIFNDAIKKTEKMYNIDLKASELKQNKDNDEYPFKADINLM